MSYLVWQGLTSATSRCFLNVQTWADTHHTPTCHRDGKISRGRLRISRSFFFLLPLDDVGAEPAAWNAPVPLRLVTNGAVWVLITPCREFSLRAINRLSLSRPGFRKGALFEECGVLVWWTLFELTEHARLQKAAGTREKTACESIRRRKKKFPEKIRFHSTWLRWCSS